MTFGIGEADPMQRAVDALTHAYIRDPYLVRKMPSLLHKAGFVPGALAIHPTVVVTQVFVHSSTCPIITPWRLVQPNQWNAHYMMQHNMISHCCGDQGLPCIWSGAARDRHAAVHRAGGPGGSGGKEVEDGSSLPGFVQEIELTCSRGANGLRGDYSPHISGL